MVLLGQDTSSTVGTIPMTNAEASDFVSAATALAQFLNEHASTSRVFCGTNRIPLAISVLMTEAARIKKAVDQGAPQVAVSAPAFNAFAIMTDCAMKVSAHIHLIDAVSIVGWTVTLSGLTFKHPVLVWGGIGVAAAAKTLGPLVKIPVLE